MSNYSAFCEKPMVEYGRILDAGRKAQGFKSQDQLDAFYRHYDHVHSCAECCRPGPSAWIDDGMQPTMNECDEGKRLFVAQWEVK